MSAMVFRRFGDPGVLEVAEVDRPHPGAGQVLVRVAAVSVGRLLDVAARAGRHPYARFVLPHILGAEHAGVIAALGEGVPRLQVGQRVAVFPVVTCGACPACVAGDEEACPDFHMMGLHGPGGYAEYTSVPASNVHPLPADLSPSAAAALALSGPVAANQLARAGFTAGDWVLVQGASSALGSLTARYVVHLGGRVIATSRSPWKRERLLELGASAALDPTDPGFVDEVLSLTEGRGVPIAIDNLGDPAVWSGSLAALATRGAAVTSGAFLGGRITVDVLRLYSRCQRIIGVRTGNPHSAERLWAEVERGFRPVLDRAFPIRQAADAHRYLETDRTMGRVTLTTADADWRPA
jgi:NADPH:quinone reductase-like Zn-dependent oxidoreductase